MKEYNAMHTPKQPWITGDGFLIRDTSSQDIFTREESSEVQIQTTQVTKAFLGNEVFPHTEEIENMAEGLLPERIKKVGKLELLAIDVPHTYGSLGIDLIASVLVTEKIVPSSSFSVVYAVHTFIDTLPLVYFGTTA